MGHLKHIIGLFFAIGLLSLVPSPTRAQQISVDVEQSVIPLYGDVLIFNVRATATSTLTGARLTVQILNRTEPFVETIPITAGSTVTISQEISIETLGLPPVATLTYFWDFQNSDGQEYRSEAFIIDYYDTQVPWEWMVATQGSISVYTPNGDPTVSNASLEIAVESLAQAQRNLGITEQPEIHIYVYPALAALANSLRLHGQQVQDWVAAYAIPDQGAVLVSSAPGEEMLVNLRRDLPHEITHIVVYSAAGMQTYNVPGWFNEGLALMSATEPDASLQEVLDQAIEDRVLLSMNTLCTPSFTGLSHREAALAYAQSENLVRYISKRYGSSQIGALMTAYRDGLGCSEGVELALGISLSELESQWLNDLSRTAGRSSPSESRALTPWLAAWAVTLALALLFIWPQPRVDAVFGDTQIHLQPIPDDKIA